MENEKDIELYERVRELETRIGFACTKIEKLATECDQCRAKKMIDWAIRLILGAVLLALIALVLRR